MAKKSLIYGRKPVLELLEEGIEIERIFLQQQIVWDHLGKIYDFAKARKIPVQKVPRMKLDRLVRGNHQGIVALKSLVSYQQLNDIILATFEQGDVPLILILDHITDVRNFGAIARSAEVLGAHAILIPSSGAAQINEDSVKTSAGAILRIPVCRTNRLDTEIQFLKQHGLLVFAAAASADTVVEKVDLRGPSAIILGAEGKGIHPRIMAKADIFIKIPQFGKIESLNVAVSAGIFLYEAQRQRKQKS
jgi:23S rRNA (guanosine2251-2'-O)-methyltransferase